MSARDEFPVLAMRVDGLEAGAREGAEIIKAFALIDKLRATPPHPAHVPWVSVGNGVMLRGESGEWLMVLPEKPKSDPFAGWAHPPVQQYCGPGCTVCNP